MSSPGACKHFRNRCTSTGTTLAPVPGGSSPHTPSSGSSTLTGASGRSTRATSNACWRTGRRSSCSSSRDFRSGPSTENRSRLREPASPARDRGRSLLIRPRPPHVIPTILPLCGAPHRGTHRRPRLIAWQFRRNSPIRPHGDRRRCSEVRNRAHRRAQHGFSFLAPAGMVAGRPTPATIRTTVSTPNSPTPIVKQPAELVLAYVSRPKGALRKRCCSGPPARFESGCQASRRCGSGGTGRFCWTGTAPRQPPYWTFPARQAA